jgi:Spy/CpxP family protein refolding chaperone
MKKGLMILVALSIALLMNASMLVAQEKAAAGKEMGSCMKEMKAGEKDKDSCGKEMKLTEEQKTKLEELKMNFRLKMIDLKAEREKLGIMLKKEMMKPEPVMNDIEGIVKKMSAVREKIQLAGIEHMLAMRKIFGPEACKGMSCGTGMACGMAGMREMSCGEEEDDCMMMCESGQGMGEECGMPAGRMMRMRMEAPGCAMEKGSGRESCYRAEGMKGCEMEGKKSCRAEGMKGGCAMAMGAPGAGRCEGAMKADCRIMMKECSERSPRMYGSWHRKMFRPFGKKECCPAMSGCKMEKGGAGACGGKGAMKGGCMMGKDAAAGCPMGGAGKEIKCKMEIKEVKEDPKK